MDNQEQLAGNAGQLCFCGQSGRHRQDQKYHRKNRVRLCGQHHGRLQINCCFIKLLFLFCFIILLIHWVAVIVFVIVFFFFFFFFFFWGGGGGLVNCCFIKLLFYFCVILLLIHWVAVTVFRFEMNESRLIRAKSVHVSQFHNSSNYFLFHWSTISQSLININILAYSKIIVCNKDGLQGIKF